jgi:hypothetical protein
MQQRRSGRRPSRSAYTCPDLFWIVRQRINPPGTATIARDPGDQPMKEGTCLVPMALGKTPRMHTQEPSRPATTDVPDRGMTSLRSRRASEPDREHSLKTRSVVIGLPRVGRSHGSRAAQMNHPSLIPLVPSLMTAISRRFTTIGSNGSSCRACRTSAPLVLHRSSRAARIRRSGAGDFAALLL